MRSTILDQSDLALLRAALRFWIDEMSPYDAATWALYFNDADDDHDGSDLRAVRLLQALESVEVRYFALNLSNSTMPSVRLSVETPVSDRLTENAAIGTAILPTLD
ncbi:hypothetical protein [Blastopirellula retiformator]|uniref:Uncharacterized protein n=1 Tax=Blastopirellula retiformator TaxID=2527970 RepID=A0A5C5VMK1_9BACT|nr:hypothetical protein [Blastopirellula retiformator]TWT38942.1 hypothetical protein Enr8_06360 [Blastopirellula retiformator]